MTKLTPTQKDVIRRMRTNECGLFRPCQYGATRVPYALIHGRGVSEPTVRKLLHLKLIVRMERNYVEFFELTDLGKTIELE